jgi:hypothetical protein
LDHANAGGLIANRLQPLGYSPDPGRSRNRSAHGLQFRKFDLSLQASGIDSLDLVAAGTETGNPATLQFQRSGDALAISWTPNGGAGTILQSADSPVGPWIEVPGAALSPYVTKATATRKFYRICQQ